MTTPLPTADLIGRKHVAGAVASGLATIVAVGVVLGVIIRPHDPSGWYDLARTAAVVLAALGAVPAGYIAYRRQQTLEGQRHLDTLKQALAQESEDRLRAAEALGNKEREKSDNRASRAEFRARYTDAALQLGNANAAVRLAGVYAMAQLADDWAKEEPSQRQMCVNVLCAYLRMPSSNETPTPANEVGAEQQVRTTVLEVLRDHLLIDRAATAPEAWYSLNFDLSGARLKDAILSDIKISGAVRFDNAQFEGDITSFERCQLIGPRTSFKQVRFASHTTSFEGIRVAGERFWFDESRFEGVDVSFGGAVLESAVTSFKDIQCLNPESNCTFDKAKFLGEATTFTGAKFGGKRTTFHDTNWMSKFTTLDGSTFSAAETFLDGSQFGSIDSSSNNKLVLTSTSMVGARFEGARVSFQSARFDGTRVNSFDAVFVNALISIDGSRQKVDRDTPLGPALGLE